jgi:hypothetical protein
MSSESLSQQCLEPLNFHNVITTTQLKALMPLQPGQKQRTRGKVAFSCNICNSYSTTNRNHAKSHISQRHPTASSSSASQHFHQAQIPTMLARRGSPDILRSRFNQQAYNEAIIGLLTRRRLPFSAVEWTEFRDLVLAYNPMIKDCIITLRRTAVRLILANFNLYLE